MMEGVWGGRSVVGSLWPVLVEETQLYIINPRHACTARVAVVVLCVCLSVRTCYSGSTRD